MRVVKDTKPRYRVQGIASMKGQSFGSEKDAIKQAQIHAIMEVLWHAWKRGEIDFKVPNPSYSVACVIREWLVTQQKVRDKEPDIVTQLLLPKP